MYRPIHAGVAILRLLALRKIDFLAASLRLKRDAGDLKEHTTQSTVNHRHFMAEPAGCVWHRDSQSVKAVFGYELSAIK
jgi:hypothetical protein